MADKQRHDTRRILIVSYFFHPEISPRAFRAFELAREFGRRGYLVDVVIPDNNFDYGEIEKKEGLKITKVPSGIIFRKQNIEAGTGKGPAGKSSALKRVAAQLLKTIFIEGTTSEFFLRLWHYFSADQPEYDLVISIGLPFNVHLGVWKMLKTQKTVAFADYGDSFAAPALLKKIEKKVLKRFDWILVPTESVRQCFNGLKDLDRVKILPQGLRFDDFKTAKYSPNLPISFAYAGSFYEDLRDPTTFFDFLGELKQDFRFHIFANTSHPFTRKIIEKYQAKLGVRLVVSDLVPRAKCIEELSRMDFIVSQKNLNADDRPSKLIDYALAKRPVFIYSQSFIDKDLFMKFLERDYEGYFVELNRFHHIENVVAEIENLADAIRGGNSSE